MSNFDTLNIPVDASSGPVSKDLPSSILSTVKSITYTKTDGSANTVNVSYKGSVAKTLTTQNESVSFIPSGLTWVEV